MRPLVYAALFFALAGCSMPYEGTSFKATPKPEKAAEGEKRASNEEERFSPDGAAAVATESVPSGTKGEMDRTSVVFPSTDQPGG